MNASSDRVPNQIIATRRPSLVASTPGISTLPVAAKAHVTKTPGSSSVEAESPDALANICPISYRDLGGLKSNDIFQSQDGQKYYRPFVKAWLSKHNESPYTRQPVLEDIAKLWPELGLENETKSLSKCDQLLLNSGPLGKLLIVGSSLSIVASLFALLFTTANDSQDYHDPWLPKASQNHQNHQNSGVIIGSAIGLGLSVTATVALAALNIKRSRLEKSLDPRTVHGNRTLTDVEMAIVEEG